MLFRGTENTRAISTAYFKVDEKMTINISGESINLAWNYIYIFCARFIVFLFYCGLFQEFFRIVNLQLANLFDGLSVHRSSGISTSLTQFDK